jgi:micrococcal nuclease
MQKALKGRRAFDRKGNVRLGALSLAFFGGLVFLWPALFQIPGLFSGEKAAGALPAVVKVDDGDTVRLSDGTVVRYLGIDTPELAHDGSRPEPFAKAAARENARLVLDKKVRLQTGARLRDPYGRLLAMMYLPDGLCVNGELLDKGLAWCLWFPGDGPAAEDLLPRQRAAMKKGTGVWKGLKERKGAYIGNARTRRFHAAGCPLGKKTARENRVPFASAWEAFWAGHAPCAECLGEWPGR